MLIHYLKIAFRNLRRYKLNSFINIIGLSVSVALFILIARYIQDEVSTDKFHENRDRLYRVEVVDFSASCAAGFKDILMNQFPEIESAVRFNSMKSTKLSYENTEEISKDISLNFDKLITADSTFFELFSFPLVDGNSNSCLTEPYSIVLTQSSASKLFGEEDPLGKTIIIDNSYNCMVTGIMQDIPANSSIDIDGVVSMITMNSIKGPNYLKDMSNWFYTTYLLLPQEHNALLLQEKISNFVSENFNNNEPIPLVLRQFSSLYFNTQNFPGDYSKHGNMQFIYVFIAVAIIIILIAIINFVNISTATASKRAKEVGVRKVVGSNKRSLIQQFLGEAILISMISIFIAGILTELLKPEFNSIINNEMKIGYLDSPLLLMYLILGAVGIGITAGIYPAFYLTSFKPVQVLKGQTVKGKGGNMLRRLLTIFQFIIAIVLIIGTLVIKQQIAYMKGKDMGLNDEKVVELSVNKQIRAKQKLFKDKLVQNPHISGVTFSSLKPGGMDGENYTRKVEGTDRTFYYLMADDDFADVLELEIVQGRYFNKNAKSEVGRSIVLNETAVKQFGLDNPIGTNIPLFDTIGTVVGVVRDFHFKSMHTEIEPLSILCYPRWTNSIQLKVAGEDMSEVLKYVEEVWSYVSPDYSFEYKFLDESFEGLYKAEERFGKIIIYFSLFAIFIACLGLFGLISHTAAQRTKEICIRKVNGASVSKIVLMLSTELLIWVLIAFVIACPIAYYMLDNWLQNFAFHTHINPLLFILAGIMAFAVALATTSFKAIKVATGNISEGLRYE